MWTEVRLNSPLNRSCHAFCIAIGFGAPQLEIGRCGIMFELYDDIGGSDGAGGSFTTGFPGGSFTSGWLVLPPFTGCDDVSGGGGD